MPIVGLLLGHGLATALGRPAHWIGAGLLIATGLYALVQAAATRGARAADDQAARLGPGRMLITGLALSIDNLAVGFALGTYHLNVMVAALVIGAVSVAMSLLGLELGSRIGSRAAGRGELIGGVVLIAVGIALAAGVI
jgi:putative Mn2+ efflux pump MntP